MTKKEISGLIAKYKNTIKNLGKMVEMSENDTSLFLASWYRSDLEYKVCKLEEILNKGGEND